MNYYFKVLWFEDEVGWYNMEKNNLDVCIEKYNLVSDVTRKNGIDFDVSDIISNEYDLILMDYKLAEETGDKIISRIRNNDILTDIVFYSSQFDDMVDSIKDLKPPIDGIYYANRKKELFEQKVDMLIGKIVKRSEDLINLRGFVMDNSCDFEVRIKEIINVLWNKMSSNEKEVLNVFLKENTKYRKKRINDGEKKIYAEEDPFSAANNDKYFLSHADRLLMIEKMMKTIDEKRNTNFFGEFARFKGRYEEDISAYRNALGHRQIGESAICVKGENVPIDEALHKLLRNNIKDYDCLIGRLEKIVLEKM